MYLKMNGIENFQTSKSNSVAFICVIIADPNAASAPAPPRWIQLTYQEPGPPPHPTPSCRTKLEYP